MEDTETKRKRAVIADDEDEEQIEVGVAPEENNNEEVETLEKEDGAVAAPEEEEEGDAIDDLFGDDDDEEEGEHALDSRPADDDGIVHDSQDEQDDEHDPFLVHEEETTRELRVGEEDIIRHPPKFDGKDGDVYIARIPKFLHVNPSRFDGTDHLKQLEQLSNSGITKEEIELKRLQDENTVRWRLTKQSNESLTAESNAQMIEWEDGSISLKLGDECFDVLQSSLADTYLVTSEGSEETTKAEETKLLVSDGSVKKTVKFVPTSTNSKIHQKLTTAIRSRQQTKATTQSVVVENDPGLESKRLEKEQEDRLREKRRELQKLERDQERLGSAGPGATRDRYSTRETYSRAQDDYDNDDGFIDDDEDEDDDVMEDVDEDDDEEEDEDDLAAERLKRVKEDGAAKYNEEEQEEPQTRKKRRVIEDDEDDE